MANPHHQPKGTLGYQFWNQGKYFFFVCLSRKLGGVFPVLRKFTAKYDVFATLTEYVCECLYIEFIRPRRRERPPPFLVFQNSLPARSRMGEKLWSS
jgi:hypothetical protein